MFLSVLVTQTGESTAPVEPCHDGGEGSSDLDDDDALFETMAAVMAAEVERDDPVTDDPDVLGSIDEIVATIHGQVRYS
jgi:hypothetical protein